MMKQAMTFGMAVTFASAASAGATYGFEAISNNSGNSDLIATQFALTVSDNAGQAEFKFENAGDVDAGAVIAEIYWDDDASVLLSPLASWSSVSGGVNYGAPINTSASPSNLPGGNNIGFEATSGLLTDPVNPGPANGVGAGEDISIFINYAASFDIDDVIAALDNGTLRVGFHGISLGEDNQFSDGFVTTGTPTGVPSPTAALAGVGLMGLLASRRRRRD